MSVSEKVDETYCDTQDVYKYFRVMAGPDEKADFDEATNPTASQVNGFIEAASAKVDRRTGHAWRERQVRDEITDLDGTYYYWAGTPISTMKRMMKTPLDSEEGDKLEVYDGEEWIDWVSSDEYTEGRDEDYWINRADGLLYIYRRSVWYETYQSIRLTYRYGDDYVPADIREATAKWAASDIVESDIFGDMLPAGNNSGGDMNATAQSWRKQARRTCDNRKEIRTV